MNKSFKFRYASEIAGAFVLLAVVLLLAGIFFAGHYQGWFEGKFVLRARFETEEGSFGLQQGNEVRVMNTLAGRVGKILPTETGSIETTFIIQNRFRPFVHMNSVAKIKKKFGLAGDSFVEIERGGGAIVKDGYFIECVQDEEIMEIAQKVLKDVRSTLLPMLEDARRILGHVNSIGGSIENEQGIAGSIIKDKKLADNVKTAVEQINGLLLESQATFRETRRLVKGLQKHWLVRKYVEHEKAPELLFPSRLRSREIVPSVKSGRSALEDVKAADNSSGIARNAYNLAICLLAERRYDEAGALLLEVHAESPAVGEIRIRARLLEAEIARLQGKPEEALQTAGSAMRLIDGSFSKEQRLQCHILMAELYCNTGHPGEARSELKKAKPLLKKTRSPRLKALSAGLWGRVLLLEEKADMAATQFDAEADIFRETGLYLEMAHALESAGEAYEQAENFGAAADRYFRAGRSFMSGGYPEPAVNAVNRALPAAKRADDGYLLMRITRLHDDVRRSQFGP